MTAGGILRSETTDLKAKAIYGCISDDVDPFSPSTNIIDLCFSL